MQDVLDALIAQGIDVAAFFRNSVEITKQFLYEPANDDIRDRIKPRKTLRKTLPVVNRTLAQVLPFFLQSLRLVICRPKVTHSCAMCPWC